MIEGWSVVVLALGYVCILFALAWYADRAGRFSKAGSGRPLIYALSLAVYCTSWTFFGSVGLAATTGYDFIPVYLGPVLLFAFGWRFLLRIVRLAKSQNITSVADFLAARYGKSQAVAAIVTVIAVAGTLPYIALQLKAVALSVDTLLGARPLRDLHLPTDTAFIIALTMATFAVLFGTRHIDATEHQEGLIVAVAAESLVKLATFLTVGFFVTFSMLGGIGGLSGVAPAIWTQLRGWPKDVARAFYQPCIVVAHVATILTLGTVALDRKGLVLFALALPVLLLGAWAGWSVYGRLDENRFRQMFSVLLIVSGLILVL